MLNQDELGAIALALNQMLDQDNLATERKLSNEQRASAIRATGYVQDLLSGDMIGSYWTIGDVFSLAEGEMDDREPVEVTEEQAREVLKRADQEHDATQGINWDVLRYHLDAVVAGKESK